MEAAAAILRELPARRRAAAFERECERLRPLGEAYLMHRFGGQLNRADAEDAVAEVLIRLHRQVAEGRPPRNLRAAFFTGVRNAAIGQLRARSARPTVALEAAATAAASAGLPSEAAESRDDAARLQEALRRLRGNYREALLLRFGLGLTVPEIARQLRISVPAAKKRVLRSGEQVRKRLAEIEAQEFCPQMRELARRSLFEKEASGLASEAERRVLHAHFEHCGACRSFLASLHDNLHELGAAALLGLTAANRLSGAWMLERLTSRLTFPGRAAQSGVARVRHLAFKANGTFGPADGGAGGALLGSGQKLAAICTAGAASAATCLATGVIGPGIGAPAGAPAHHDLPAAKVRAARRPPAAWTAPTAAASGAASAAQSRPATVRDPAQHSRRSSAARAPARSPSQQAKAEFGFEAPARSSSATSASPSASSSSSVAPAAPPATPSSGSGSTARSGGGTESFGFHG
jgi:RNA polymerase sigma factor (sigma-70 family)